MNKPRLIILGFGSFLVLAVAVLAIGMWRKGALSDELRERLDEANQILDGKLHDFLRKTPEEQKDLLRRARQSKRAIEADPKAPADKARDLGMWVAHRVALQAVVDKRRRELATLRRELQHDFLTDRAEHNAAERGLPCRQASPKTVESLRAAARKAEKAGDDLTATVGGRPVDLSPAIGNEVRELKLMADKAMKELELRERAFAVFAQDMERARDERNIPKVTELAGRLDEWFSCVVGADKKERRLKNLETRHAYVARGPEMERILHKRLDELTRVLTTPKLPSEVRLALSQADEAIRDAEHLLKVFPHSPVKGKIRAVEQGKQKAQKWLKAAAGRAQAAKGKQDVIDNKILFRIAALIDPKARPKNVTEWQKAAKPIHEAISDIRKMDPNIGFLANLLDATKPKPPPAPTITHVKWIGPDWKPFDENIKGLRALEQECFKYRGRTNPPRYWPVRPLYVLLVGSNFDSAYTAIKGYLIAWDRFKANTEGELAERRRESSPKKKPE